jgi:hypothetical protein
MKARNAYKISIGKPHGLWIKVFLLNERSVWKEIANLNLLRQITSYTKRVSSCVHIRGMHTPRPSQGLRLDRAVFYKIKRTCVHASSGIQIRDLSFREVQDGALKMADSFVSASIVIENAGLSEYCTQCTTIYRDVYCLCNGLERLWQHCWHTRGLECSLRWNKSSLPIPANEY